MIAARHMGGKRHQSIDAFNGVDALLYFLPGAFAKRVIALKLLRHHKIVDDRSVPFLWLSSIWHPKPTPPGDITFEYPPFSSRIWEILDTAGNTTEFKRNA